MPWSTSRLSLIHLASSLLSTPGISKSAAAASLSATCWLFMLLPISRHSWAQRNPDDIINGLSKWDRIGCKIFTARATKKKEISDGEFETYLEFLSQTNSKGLI